MESFQITNELIDDLPDKIRYFGNMKFYKQGRRAINTKIRGLYLSLILLIVTFSCTEFLMYFNFYKLQFFFIKGRG
jgi:hypothetical protein